MADVDLSDMLAGLLDGSPQPSWEASDPRLRQQYFDELAQSGRALRVWSYKADPTPPSEDFLAAARAAGYGVTRIKTHGTGNCGVWILTARSRRAARMLREGRRRALQRELGCTEDEARAIEPVCRPGWVRERADQVLEHLRWLRSTHPATVRTVLDTAWRAWVAEGEPWGPAVDAAARIIDLDAPSVPRLDALLQAAFQLAHRELGWEPPELPGRRAAQLRDAILTGRIRTRDC